MFWFPSGRPARRHLVLLLRPRRPTATKAPAAAAAPHWHWQQLPACNASLSSCREVSRLEAKQCATAAAVRHMHVIVGATLSRREPRCYQPSFRQQQLRQCSRSSRRHSRGAPPNTPSAAAAATTNSVWRNRYTFVISEQSVRTQWQQQQQQQQRRRFSKKKRSAKQKQRERRGEQEGLGDAEGASELQHEGKGRQDVSATGDRLQAPDEIAGHVLVTLEESLFDIVAVHFAEALRSIRVGRPALTLFDDVRVRGAYGAAAEVEAADNEDILPLSTLALVTYRGAYTLSIKPFDDATTQAVFDALVSACVEHRSNDEPLQQQRQGGSKKGGGSKKPKSKASAAPKHRSSRGDPTSSVDDVLNPYMDGNDILIQFPRVSKDAREALVRGAHKKAEDMRASIRRARQRAMNEVKQHEKEWSKDEVFSLKREIQDKIDTWNESLKKLLDEKEKEILAGSI